MNDESARERSPRSPVVALQKCIEYIGKLHVECRRTAVPAEVAAKAMGFQSLHGGVNTLLAGLREYDLIDRPQGKVVLTALAVKILHPVSEEQREAALREAALAPKLFASLIQDFGDSSLPVLESHLVQSGFIPDRAAQVAKVFLANKAFAKLEPGSKVDGKENFEEDGIDGNKPEKPTGSAGPLAILPPKPPASTITPPVGNSFSFKGEMLAQYNIPLGANQAYLAFTGEQLVPEDFDALLEYVELFKKQFERRLKSVPQPAPEIVTVPPSKEVADAYFTQHGRPLTKSEYDPDSQE